MEGFVYILRRGDGSFYIGSTINIARRFNEHQNGLMRATKHLLPVVLMFYKKYPTILQARRVEYKLKKSKSRKIIEQILSDKDIKIK